MFVGMTLRTKRDVHGDNIIHLANASGRGGEPDRLSDDELTTLMSGFRRSVTLTVFIEACYSGGMFDGTADQESAAQFRARTEVAAIMNKSDQQP